jgi:peroxiredoxin
MPSAKVPQEIVDAIEWLGSIDAPLQTRLDDFAGVMRSRFPQVADAVERLIARLQDAGAGRIAPDIGDELPDFLLPDQTGRLTGLADVVSNGPTAITFFRGHWCPYCQIQARSLAKAYSLIEASGGTLVAITPELRYFTNKHRALANARYEILSDVDNGYAMSLNLAIWVGEEMQKFMSEFGRDLTRYQGNPSWFLPIPATFVVDTSRVIRARFIDPDYRKRMDTDDLIAAITAARQAAPAANLRL